ncbi:MAG: UbiA family prenyltransferase [Bacillota bacterium]|nr:UbiA family prenyltransferase [Bacillota bacterium]
MRYIKLKKKIKGAIQLFRPELSCAAGISVIAGELIALGRFPSILNLLYGFTCGFFISSPALILNDYFDLKVDRINAPNRPLPSGIITPAEVIALTIFAAVLGLASSALMGVYALIISIILLIIGFLYNWKLKETGLPGNLLVSFSVAATYILGGIAVLNPWNKIVITFSIMVFFIDLGEEISADAMDIDGDRMRNSKSIAIRMGRKFALNAAGILFFIAIIISLIPIYFHWLGISYLFMILIFDAVTLSSVLRLLRSKTSEEGLFYIKRIYRGGSLGLLIFVVSQLFF